MIVSEKVLNKLDFNKIRERLSNHCVLPRAKEFAEKLEPESDLRFVRQLLRETDEACTLLRFNPLFSVRGAKEIRKYLERSGRGGILTAEELLPIRDTLKTARQVQTVLLQDDRGKKDYAELFALKDIVKTITPQKLLEDEISGRISEEGKVKDDASEELRRLRRTINNLQNKIKESLDNILRSSSYQKMLQDQVITFRGDRYVVPVKHEYASVFSGIVHDQSASGATVFIEPTIVVQLGNELRETVLKEKREVEKILQELTAKVAVKVEVIAHLYETLARIDFILAKAHLSIEMNAGSPIVINKQEIKLLSARHPLLKGEVVPLSVELGLDFDFLIVTGPNTGGKTVALKTLGLMVLMTQSGLHIPAESESRIGVFDKVFVDIGDEQSVEQSLSTFSGHMTNIVDIMNQADAKSLILFDEIGAGTDPTEGAALAMGIISELLDRGCKGIATTHYGTLKTFAYNDPRLENASVEFNAETLKPTFRLVTGIPGRSNAFSIAERLGLSNEVLEKAKSFISERQMQMSDLLENLEDTQRHIEIEKRRAEEERYQAQERAAMLEKKAAVMEHRQEELLHKAREEAVQIVRQARVEAEKVIKEIKEAQKKERKEQLEAMEKSRQKIKKLSDGLYGGDPAKKTKLKPEQIKPGQNVYLPNLRQKGQVLTKPDNNNEVTVQAGILKVSVPLSEIRLIDESRRPDHFEKSMRGSMGLSKAVTLRSEVDLRGKLVEEAEEILDKYLDDAVLTGINQVSIIHGKGTGALRAGIHQFLKKHPHVREFRMGEYGEGDTGVTIVDLK